MSYRSMNITLKHNYSFLNAYTALNFFKTAFHSLHLNTYVPLNELVKYLKLHLSADFGEL